MGAGRDLRARLSIVAVDGGFMSGAGMLALVILHEERVWDVVLNFIASSISAAGH